MVSCKMLCPAGWEDEEGNYMPCKGHGFPDIVRLREHLTRVHCAGGDRHKADVRQLSKEQIGKWFRLWNQRQSSRAEGWIAIFTELWPRAVIPPPFNPSKEDMLLAARSLSADGTRFMQTIALQDHRVELPPADSRYVAVSVDYVHEYLRYTGGDATGAVGDAQLLPGSTATEPASLHDVYTYQNPWPNHEHTNTN